MKMASGLYVSSAREFTSGWLRLRAGIPVLMCSAPTVIFIGPSTGILQAAGLSL